MKLSAHFDHSHQPIGRKRQRPRKRFPWWSSSWFGYVACVLLLAALVGIEKLDEYVPQAPLFVGTPFALASIVVAMIWGLGPALVSLVLGLFVLAVIIPSGIVTPNLFQDLTLDGPFLLVQLVAILVVLSFERSHRELKRTHQQLVESKAELEQANAVKDALITRASHELRTPLTTILGRSQLLAARLRSSGAITENETTLRSTVDVIEGRALHLCALLNGLFDLSHLPRIAQRVGTCSPSA